MMASVAPCFTESRIRSWRACQRIDECPLVILAQLDHVSRFARSNRCLVNAADNEVGQRNATQSRRFPEQPLLLRADARLKAFVTAVGGW
jgi:hypothetical protein